MHTLYGIKNCDTCRKARKALDAQGLEHRFHDLREDGLDADRLDRWLARVSALDLLNRRSTTWRSLDKHDKAELDEALARKLMLAHPTLIKRPLLETNDTLVVGYRDGDYAGLTN